MHPGWWAFQYPPHSPLFLCKVFHPDDLGLDLGRKFFVFGIPHWQSIDYIGFVFGECCVLFHVSMIAVLG
jgi:hypothetical protein